MPICACNKVRKIIKPNTSNTNNSTLFDDEQAAVSSSDSQALVNVNSSTPTFKAQRYGKGEGIVQFMKQIPVLILQGMKVKVVTQEVTADEQGMNLACHIYIMDFTELGSCTSDPFSPPPASDVPQGDALPPWEFGGCPDAWDDSITYSGGDYVSSSSTVYKCKNGPNEQFCNLIPPEGLNGHSGSLGWETIGSCTGTLDPLPAPTCGDIPTYTEDFLTNANWESEPQQVVNVDGTIYRCQTFFAAAAWCSNSQYDPTGMAGYLAWDTCTSCASYEATGSLGSNCPDVAS